MNLSNAEQSSRFLQQQQQQQQQRFLYLTELRITGPFLELSERGIERLAEALAGGRGRGGGMRGSSSSSSSSNVGLRTLVLSVQAIDRPSTLALEGFFRSPNGENLAEFSLWARTATERRVGTQTRTVPMRSVLGPALSGWVDAWTASNSNGDGDGDGDYAPATTDGSNNDAGYDEDKLVDNYYDDYNYCIGGDGDGDDYHAGEHNTFQFDGDDLVGSHQNNHNNNKLPQQPVPSRRSRIAVPNHQRTRACCVVASMLRVNTSLRRLVLAPEGGGSGEQRSRSLLSVRSTLAIARALRDHVSVLDRNGNRNRDRNPDTYSEGETGQRGSSRPAGSSLETLVLSTDYYGGNGNNGNSNGGSASSSSSWAIRERKRAVGKVFWQALTNANANANANRSNHRPLDLKEQLEGLLRNNKELNQSRKRIHSVWIPRLSSLTATPEDDNEDDDDDDDCQFVVASASATATIVSSLPRVRSRSRRPPTMVLVLPELLELAGREAAGFDTIFQAARTLARRTDLWDEAVRYRCKHPPRYRRHRHHHRGRFCGGSGGED
eukprot:jgi/Psemu1/328286/estExt_fgenesh1_pg.C_11620008